LYPTTVEVLAFQLSATECGTAGLTVNVAVALVVDPAVLLTTTSNVAPLSDDAVAGVV
jgi:hypothetical protein